MDSTTRQEDKDNIKVQQQLSIRAVYVTGYLSQQLVVCPAAPYFLGGPRVLLYQPTSSCYWSLFPIIFVGSYHVMY